VTPQKKHRTKKHGTQKTRATLPGARSWLKPEFGRNSSFALSFARILVFKKKSLSGEGLSA
jgi:cellulase/cellobiase CelA1